MPLSSTLCNSTVLKDSNILNQSRYGLWKVQSCGIMLRNGGSNVEYFGDKISRD
jgi:hypothetical protein